MKRVIKTVTDTLERDLSALDRKLFRDRVRQLARSFVMSPALKETAAPAGRNGWSILQLITFLAARLQSKVDQIDALRTLMADFTYQFSRTPSEKERNERMLSFAEDLGADAKQLRGDRRAFQRWFGYDTVMERGYRRISECEYELSFLLDRLGGLVAGGLKAAGSSSAQKRLLHHLDIEKLIQPLLVFRGDDRIRVAAFSCLARIFKAMRDDLRSAHLSEGTMAFIYRASIDVRQSAWIQTEALVLLSSVNRDSFLQAIDRRLTSPHDGDDFFVRKKAVLLLADHADHEPHELQRLLDTVAADPSPFVRQTLSSVLITMLSRPRCRVPAEDLIRRLRDLMLHDASPQVRAAAALALMDAMDTWAASGGHSGNGMPENGMSECLSELLSRETDAFVLRVGLKTCGDIIAALKARDEHGCAVTLLREWGPLLSRLHQQADDLNVRRWAALARERMFVTVDSRSGTLKQRLTPLIDRTRPGKSRRVPKAWFRHVDDIRVGRVLSVLSRDNFGLSLKRGVTGTYLIRGERFAFRLWRLLYELFSPSPDKRQGVTHVIGRIYSGHLRAPSAIGSEMTRTKVPGEPLFVDTEGGWRPYLPLVDEMLSCTRRWWRCKTVRVFTAEGVTEICPPRYIWDRFRAYMVLTLRFAAYAKLRNWRENSQAAPNGYTRALKRLGFTLRFNGYEWLSGPKDEDPAVSRFFAVGVPFLPPDLWPAFKHYFFSAYENSIYELGLFATALLVMFVGRRLYLSYRVQQSRRKLKLVIGGWGTRGKSGVERLKSSIFEALGHGFVNKTPGCEAMFLHTLPFGKTREMFLFRPYDKATIWEHNDLIRMTAKLKAEIFLWECMALNPSLVSILQKHWTRDDFSTITNTYPDHEDIQGPAGRNIPQVMTQFIPPDGHLITSEEEMKHILADDARRKKTRMDYTGWLEAGMLTTDVLDRFPYEEHPNNIALVLKMSTILGIDTDFVLKEMADRVVPDIGALKVYPAAHVNDRKLEFVNGMSANERFAALENWRRMGFANHDPHDQPEVMISSLVNNRADRVSRSRMFAAIIAEDLSVDRHFLIGSNLTGLSGMIRTAWERYLGKINLYAADDDSKAYALQVFSSMVKRLKICDSADLLQRRLHNIIRALECELPEAELSSYLTQPEGLQERLKQDRGEKPLEAIMGWHESWLEELNAVVEFKATLENDFKKDKNRLNTAFKQLATQWFMAKIILIDDVHASGNRIIHDIIAYTPPGLQNRIMGLQNIKGPGLDYVYTWQAWETCHAACRKLLNHKNTDIFEKGFQELVAFQDYNVLCEDSVTAAINTVKATSAAQSEKYQAGLTLIQSNMNQALDEIKSSLKTLGKKGVLTHLTAVIEAFLDAGDAVKRRKTAQQIYKDLIDERISHERAAIELKKLNKRQKGGWLSGGEAP